MKRKSTYSKLLVAIVFFLFGHRLTAQTYSFENSKVVYSSGCVKNRTLILEPTGNLFARDRVYNPTVITSNDSLFMIYRAEGLHTQHGVFALAFSKDGVNFNQYNQNPIMKSEPDQSGVEDPRVVKYGDSYYLFYIVNVQGKASIQIATSKDLRNWKKQGEIFHTEYDWEKKQVKAPAPLNRKLDGKYWCYYQGEKEAWRTKMGLAYSSDLKNWIKLEKPVLLPRENHFDSWGTEPEVAIVIKQGIFMLYAGWGGDGTPLNKMGWVLFDKNNPAKVLKRCEKPIVALEDGHIFGEGLEYYNGQYRLYYGVRDQWIESAEIDIEGIVNSVQ